MKQNFTLVLLSLLLLSANLFSQEASVADNNEAIFNRYVAYITPYKGSSFEKVLEQTAHFFLDTPYVGGTLEINEKEQLVVNLEGLDCVTYVENVMALSYAVFSKNLSFETFKTWLQLIRYYVGDVEGYSSRIHYTTHWIADNESMGFIKDLSQELSRVKETKEINFMSTHRNAYKQLADDDAMLEKIKHTEKNINKRGGFYYLPKQEITTKATEISHMAVVAIVTSIWGLDTSHIGFAYQKEDEELGFIHASSLQKKVVIDSKTLSEYCLRQINCKGIIVAEIINYPSTISHFINRP